MARKRRVVEEEGLNLIPIMNLVTILIPFLLMSAQFITLAVIDSTAPAIGPPQEVKDEDQPDLSLSVLITSDGFTISGKGVEAVLPKEDEVNGPKIPCLEAGCKTTESYDFAGLTERLAKLKDRYEDTENVILVPESSTTYEVLIYAMDSSRNDPTDVDDENKARELFPFVVVAGGVN